MTPARPGNDERVLAVLLVGQMLFTASATDVSATGVVDTPRAGIEPGVQWAAGNRIRLEVAGAPGAPDLSFEFTDSNDLRITFGGGQGVIILIRGEVMLTNHLVLEKGSELVALNGPMVLLKLLIELLNRAFPGGPSSVANRSPIDLAEEIGMITVSTPSGSGQFDAPWTVNGDARRRESTVQFDLHFKLSTGGGSEQELLYLAGSWQRDANPPIIRDGTSLDGWKAYELGLVTREAGDGEDLEYAATPLDGQATVGDVRRFISNRD